jgi:hypothetical protein
LTAATIGAPPPAPSATQNRSQIRRKECFKPARAPSVRIPMAVNGQCNFVAAESCAKRNRVEFAGNWRTKRRPPLPPNAPCTGFPTQAEIFALCDQTVVVTIPPAHDNFGKFRLRDLQPASGPRRCVLTFRHVNEGATCLGSDLEAQCRRRVRGVRIRRRDFAGGLLSSGVRTTTRSTKPIGKRLQHRRERLSGVLFFASSQSFRA